jgi:hypothetical protein
VTIDKIDEDLLNQSWAEYFTHLFDPYYDKLKDGLEKAKKHRELMDKREDAAKERDKGIQQNCKLPTLPPK